MERGNIKVSDKLDVKGWSVESLYILMWKNQMFVHRVGPCRNCRLLLRVGWEQLISPVYALNLS